MGLSESTLQACTKPCETCIKDTNKYCLDDMEFDSNCSKCCTIHMRTHAHKRGDEESEESAGSGEENAGEIK